MSLGAHINQPPQVSSRSVCLGLVGNQTTFLDGEHPTPPPHSTTIPPSE